MQASHRLHAGADGSDVILINRCLQELIDILAAPDDQQRQTGPAADAAATTSHP